MVSKNELLDMDHSKSYHVKTLQKSRYIILEKQHQNLYK